MASPLQEAQTHDDRVHGSPKVKVTILASEWGSSNGGLSTINRELAIQLAKFPEVEITFFLPKCSQEDKNVALDHKVKIVEATPLSCYEQLDWLCSPPEDLEIDVVVGHGVKLGKQAQIIKKSKTCKWVQVVHTDPEELGMFKSYSRPISKGAEKHKNEVELCEMADHVIGIGPKLSEAYRLHLCGGNKDGNVFELTPGVFEEFKTENHVSRGDMRQRRVLVFGRGDVEDFELKGFDIAGKAIAALQDTRLVFVGAPAGKLEETAKRLMEYGVPASRLTVKEFVGDRESLRRLLLQADLVVMPSRTEGFGLTGLEAMSAGLPVLVSRNSGFGEALCRTATGSAFVIESDDPTVWTAAIQKIWNKDRECRLEEAVNLRDIYDRKYDWAKQIQMLVDKMISLTHDRRINPPTKCTRVMSKRLLTTWLMIILLCNYSVTLLDPRSYQDGCPAEDSNVPFETKEFNMSEYLDAARAEDFIGRQWLYREVEDAFEEENIAGVQIIGSPGSGKSALASQLICSRTSSSFIHTRILGYHFCKYSDKNTQMAGKFVRNLAEMIGRRLPEYGYFVTNHTYIHHSLTEDCIHYAVGCFELAVLSPLRNLKNKPRENWFVVVDALDECLTQGETGHSIVYLLNNKIHRFPPWLKVVMTSRNESDASLHSSKVKKVTIDPEDSRNLKDLEIYVTKRLLLERSLLHRVTSWFGDDSVKLIAKLARDVLNISQGNFLFVKELLDYWELSRPDLRDAFVLPKTLGDLYQSYFERLYPREGNFKYARHVFELLVSTFDPLTQKQILELLKMRENNLDEEYDFKNRLKELGHFLKYGKDNTVTLYHLSLTEWLTSEENGKYFVSKKKGHKTFCDFYLNLIRKGKKSKLSKCILKLAQHIALSGWEEAYVREFRSLPSQIVNSSDPQSKGTLLHLAATIDNRDALELLLTHFTCIDCVDNRGITPAFLAAEHGLVDNVALLIGKGAKVNRKTKGMVAFYKAKILRDLTTLKEANNDSYLSVAYQRIDMPVYQTKSKFFGASMLHAAAKGGHERVVRFLIEKNARISILNGVHLTAMQTAAENGHLNVVKTLYEAGAVADQTALHHAAANNRMDVVNFLLEIGVKDECLRCDGFFSWLNSKHRFPSTTILLSPPFKDYCSHIRIINDDVAKICIDYEQKWPDETKKLYDDSHLIFCHSALHAAVAGGHDKVVTRLLSENHNALNCHDYSGRTPLHEAVRKNDSTIVNILLDKHPQMVKYKCKHWQEVDKTLLKFEELAEYNADVCHCGYTPLHLAARYGHLEVAILLIRKGARLDERDCTGATPVHVAACHNHANLIGGNLNIKTSNGSTPLHSAAACGAVEIIDYLLYKKASLTAVDNYGLTALHYSIHNIRFRSLVELIAPRKGHLSAFYVYDNQYKSLDGLRWLDTLVKLLHRGSNVDAVDVDGRTPLLIGAQNGLADAVNVLLQMNASVEVKNKKGKTPLEVAFENAPVESEQFPSFRATKMEDLRELLHGHDMVIFLLLSHGASSGKCASSSGSMFHTAIVKKQFHIAQLLLLKGANLTCKDSLGRTPLVTYLHNGEEFSGVLLREFTETVTIECGKSFNYSLFHLLSYIRPIFEDNNLFYLDSCSEAADPLCKVKKGPLVIAIESHPEKEQIISTCFDGEGFTPLHRAAQGAHLVAIRYLLANGANDSILSPHGHDALTLAVLHAGRRRLWERHELVWVDGDYTHLIQAEQATIKLLHHAIKNRGYKIRCDSSKADLTLYHIAASRGLVKFIEAIFNESDLHQLDADCANADGITPMYLAKLFEERVQDGLKNPWEQVIQIIRRHGGKMRYPRKNVEHNIIYNGVYGWIPNEFTIDLRPDIVHFVTSLLTSYEKKEKKSFRCFFHPQIDLTRKNVYYWPVIQLWEDINISSVKSLMRESEEVQPNSNTGRRQCSWEEEYFRRDWGRCSLHLKQFRQSMSKILFSRQAYPKNIAKLKNWEVFSKVQRNWIQKEFLSLMKMRHTEVFRAFACFKSLSSRFKPVYHLDARSVTFSIRRFEKNPPVDNYLNSICDSIEYIFENYISFRKSSQQPSEFRLRDNELFSRSGFINGPVKIFRQASFIGSNPIEWPLEFFLRRSMGFFRRYDYLKTLHVGKEPRTHVHLYPDKIRKLMDRNKMWYGHSQLARVLAGLH